MLTNPAPLIGAEIADLQRKLNIMQAQTNFLGTQVMMQDTQIAIMEVMMFERKPKRQKSTVEALNRQLKEQVKLMEQAKTDFIKASKQTVIATLGNQL